jgi:myo-inositol 2-dehydrogenase/D-chiro-inositol 1-dehydrogenase
MTVKVGVIGAGLMGTTHVRTLSRDVPAAEVVALSDAIAESAERLAGEVSIGTLYTDALALIGDPAVEAVVIASPADTHQDFVLACLELGKPCLCEKPLASSAEAARVVVEAEAELGRRLVQLGFMRRFDPGYLDLKARLDRGEIGTPVLAYSTHRNPSAPPHFGSEMIIKDTVVHDVDTLRWLLGQELITTTVFTPRPTGRAPEGVCDPQVIVFATEARQVITVEAFVNAQYGYDVGCEVVGESGVLSLPRPQPIPMGFQDRFASAYAGELESWISSVAARTAPAGASAWDGYAAAAVCEAAWDSLRAGQPTEVNLGAKPGLYVTRPAYSTAGKD